MSKIQNLLQFKHKKYTEALTILQKTDLPLLLVGEAGTGKTSLAEQVAYELDQKFTVISLNKQYSKGDFIGFKSIDGGYISTEFRTAYENGHIILLDELDAADPNTLLCLNTMENGYVSFPDARINAHPKTRIIATANPFTEHAQYTGRSKLDFSTLNRYHIIALDRDEDLEQNLVHPVTVSFMKLVREHFKVNNIPAPITMRSAIKFDKLKLLIENPGLDIFFQNQDAALTGSFMLKYEEELNDLAVRINLLRGDVEGYEYLNFRERILNPVTETDSNKN